MQIFKHQIAAIIAKTTAAQAAGLDAPAIARLFGTPPKPEMGDLALPAFPFAKAAGKPPAAAAADLKAQLDGLVSGAGLVSETRVTGPYLNIYLDTNALASTVLAEVAKASSGDELSGWRYGESDGGKGRTVVIDFSSPNIAKPLGVHHLRSTMIGNSLKKIYEACGWRVVGINHLGDWGTSFGKLIAGFLEENSGLADLLAEMGGGEQIPFVDLLTRNPELYFKHASEITIEGLSVGTLVKVYVGFSARAKSDPSLEDAGKREFAALEEAMSGVRDATNTSSVTNYSGPGYRNFILWDVIKKVSLREFESVYSTLGIGFEPYPLVMPQAKAAFEKDPAGYLREHNFYTGESYYVAGSPHCQQLLEDARKKGVAVESEGALVIFVDGPDKPPVILLKDDGATAYHTRDIAAAIYRAEHFKLDRALYVVGMEQKLHFTQMFKALKMLGHEWADECKHVDFGLVLSKDDDSGKWGKFTTRGGRVVLLHDLLNEAIETVRGIMREKNPELASDSQKLEKIAKAVGVGAVVFNDLKHGRRADVKFDWNEMLSFTGETGPYMLYQYVRLGSVTRKFVERYGPMPATPDTSLLTLEQEREILKAIAAFPEVVAKAADENEPSLISRFLLDISALFSSYWTATKGDGIVGDDKAKSAARIALVSALRKVLGRGLTLLGLELVEEM